MSNIDHFKYIPAQPGFEMIQLLEDESEEDPTKRYGILKQSIIAWEIEQTPSSKREKGFFVSVEAVTPDGMQDDDYAILQPDGKVISFCGFFNSIEEWEESEFKLKEDFRASRLKRKEKQ